MRHAAILLVLAALLSACGGGGPPRAVNAPGIKVAAGPGVAVRPGDTLYSIAQRYGVALRDLIIINGLRAPYRIATGDLLLLPVARGYEVKRGDTVSGIAQRFDIETSRLIRINGLTAPYTIFPDQRLTIPVPIERPQPAAQTRQPARVAAAPAAPKPSIVIIPPKRPEWETPRVASAPAQTQEQGTQPQATPKSPPAPVIEPVRYTEPPARSGSRFLWPVQGRVISSFGAKSDGSRNDGINIAAPGGQGVRAAENGVVAYVGDDLDAFGNLVLLRHRDGFMTAYAHLQASLVREGDVIQRGQIIGRVGDTGSVSRPQLHFEVRRRARPVDPVDHLDPVTG